MAGLNFFITVLMVQLFWSAGVTLYANSLPIDSLDRVQLFSSDSTANTLKTIGPKVQTNIGNQLNLSPLDAVTLIFYSGNLIIDLILNFMSAVPQMFVLVLVGFNTFVPVAGSAMETLKLFFFILVGVLYIIGFVTAITSLRSGIGAAF